jgi:hypothetical protein
MHIVVPIGRTKPAICAGMPRFCSATARFVGRVAALELVENAVSIDDRIRRKKSAGESPAAKRMIRESVTTTCRSRPPSTTRI